MFKLVANCDQFGTTPSRWRDSRRVTTASFPIQFSVGTMNCFYHESPSDRKRNSGAESPALVLRWSVAQDFPSQRKTAASTTVSCDSVNLPSLLIARAVG